MKKVLFIIQSYPSEMSANVLCDEKIMQAMLQNGNYEIHALTYQYNKQPLFEKINGINVHRFKRGFFWDAYTWARSNSNEKKAKFIMRLNQIILRIKQIVTIPYYPNNEKRLSKLYAREAISLHKRIGFDIIFAEHNGNDTVYAGLAVKKYDNSVKYVPVFWDALSGYTLPKYLPSRYAKMRLMKYEKEILEHCDIAITMKSHCEHMTNLWGKSPLFSKLVFLDIPYLQMGIDLSQDKHILSRDKINIVFAGSMTKRDVVPFLKSAKKAYEQQVIVWIYTASKYHSKIKEEVKDYKDIVILNDYLPHEQLVNVLGEADIFLNFGVKNPNAISGKIFEYMGYGKPIISTFSIDNEACIPYLSSYKLGFLFDERQDVDISAKSLKYFLENTLNKRIKYEEIERQYYINTPKAYLEIIDNLN